MTLDLIYDTFFCEFPLGRLSQWDSFIEEHPPIQTLAEFEGFYDEIRAAFRAHNFVEQYARQCQNDQDFRPDHTTTSQCEVNLDALRRWISTLGPQAAEAQLDYICWLHRAYDWSTLVKNTRSPLQEDIMALLSEYTRVPLKNIPLNTHHRDHTTLVPGDGGPRAPAQTPTEPPAPARPTTTTHTQPTRSPRAPRARMTVSELLTQLRTL